MGHLMYGHYASTSPSLFLSLAWAVHSHGQCCLCFWVTFSYFLLICFVSHCVSVCALCFSNEHISFAFFVVEIVDIQTFTNHITASTFDENSIEIIVIIICTSLPILQNIWRDFKLKK